MKYSNNSFGNGFTYGSHTFYNDLKSKAALVGEAQAVGEHVSLELSRPSDKLDKRMFFQEWNRFKSMS
jgi:hypothetical protein